MYHLYKNPPWIDQRLLQETKLEDVPHSFFKEINNGLAALQSDSPLVSVCIPAYNEETTILRTLYSLSKSKTTYPVEFVVVNNNSTDRTQEVLDQLHVRTFFQPKPGWGPARQMAQENARGKYILSADADCIYPDNWIQEMATALQAPGVSCVYGGYSFLARVDEPRIGYFFYETLKNIIVQIRDIKRPWYNCGGASMGYVRELSLKVGFIDRLIRGEDGRMCFALSQHGKIVRVRKAIVWTSARSLMKDGNLVHAFLNRFKTESRRLTSYFKPQPIHDTHTSNNFIRNSPLKSVKDPDLERILNQPDPEQDKIPVE